MTKLYEFIDYLEELAPSHLQESYDNAGLITGDLDQEIKGVVVCLDSTPEVIDEAISLGANVVLAHHPIVFVGLKTVTGKNYVERTIIKAIKNDIAIYALHTNLDNVYEGVNQKIAQKLGLTQVQILKNKEGTQIEDKIGAGMIGKLSEEVEEMEFLNQLKSKMELNTIKYTQLLGKKVQRVAICGGSGQFLLQDAIRQDADVFISSDFKYHEFFDADGKIVIVDVGHFESEQFTIDLLYDRIKEKFANFALHYTKVNTNPVKYL